jgi:hypothetical protein
VEKVKKDVDNYPIITYIYSMKEKKLTITSKDITQKQWSNLIIELNLVRQAWKPFAKIELHALGLKKIINQGQRKHDTRED